MYEEAFRRFRKLTEESESLPRVRPCPKGLQELTGGGGLRLMRTNWDIHTNHSRPMLFAKVNNPPFYVREGGGLRFHLPLPWPLAPMTHKYRESIIVLSISKSAEPNEEHK